MTTAIGVFDKKSEWQLTVEMDTTAEVLIYRVEDANHTLVVCADEVDSLVEALRKIKKSILDLE